MKMMPTIRKPTLRRRIRRLREQMKLPIPSRMIGRCGVEHRNETWLRTPNRFRLISIWAATKTWFGLRILAPQTYGNPVVADGKVFVGTNNGAGYRPEKHPAEEDAGVLLCFDEKTGEFLWQLTREKLPQGRVNDWPLQGICSTPVVEGDRLWVVTNRCELMCLDTNGFADDENDGDVIDEVDNEKGDADIIWNLDMIEELGVFPHNLATSSPVVHEDIVYHCHLQWCR